MKIMVNLENTDEYQELDINENLSILDLKANLSNLFGFSWNEMELLLNGNPLANHLILGQIKFNDDVVILRRVKSNLALSRSFSSSSANKNSQQNPQSNSLGQAFSQFMQNARSGNNNINYGNNNNYGGYNFLSALMGGFRSNAKEEFIQKRVKELHDRFLTSPDDLNNLFNTNPDLAEAIVSGNKQKVENIVRAQVEEAEKKQKDKEMEYIRLMNSDPNDPDVQQKIAKIIQQKNIDENLRQAEEYMPETLFPVHMLFINLEINKKKVVALVDTGAQSTIMSQALCQKCDLFNLCDTRFSGIAKGVGTGKIIGTVHAAQMKIQNKVLMAKITVLENSSIGFIFGLDNMRAHRCTIDLKENGLIFPDIGVTAKFLSDGEIKKIKEEQEEQDEKEEIEKAKVASLNPPQDKK
jgi:DNA damage-inducible protein 1